MFIDLLSESCEEGGMFLLGNEDEPISRGYVLPDQPEFLVFFYKLFQLRQTHWIRNASCCWPYLGSVRQESIVMIIKHHTYAHYTFRLCINTHKLSSIFPQIRFFTSVLSVKSCIKVRQVKIVFESANCTFGEQLQNTNLAVMIGLGWPISLD